MGLQPAGSSREHVGRALLVTGKAESLWEGQGDSWLAAFADSEKCRPWARNSIALAIVPGIITVNTGCPCPQAGATPAEAALMIARFWQK